MVFPSSLCCARTCIQNLWGSVLSSGIMPIFAYGDANFTNSSYGSKSTPTTGMLRSLQRIAGYVNVVLIDEFRTSACCATCGALVCSIKTSNISHRQQTRFKKRAAILHSRGEKEDPSRKMPDTWDVRVRKSVVTLTVETSSIAS